MAIPFNVGTSVLQRGIACGQRGWKWQPSGGLSGLGISPLMAVKTLRRDFRSGISASSAWV